MYTPQPYVYQSPVGTSPPPVVPEPWFTRYRRQLTIGAAVLGILLVMVLLVTFFLHRSRAQRAIEENQQVQRQQQIQQVLDECVYAKDQSACTKSAQPDLAQKSGNSGYCQGLEGTDWDSCITLAALTSKNAEDCQSIHDDEKKNACVNAIAALVPVDQQTFESCAAFVDADLQTSCQRAWALRQALQGNCGEHVDVELCTAGQVITQAIMAQDPDICQQISDTDFQETCLEKTLPGDRDHDGLNAQVEQALGTDDRNADTDGDGYDDAMEVNSGYNPLGAG